MIVQVPGCNGNGGEGGGPTIITIAGRFPKKNNNFANILGMLEISENTKKEMQQCKQIFKIQYSIFR